MGSGLCAEPACKSSGLGEGDTGSRPRSQHAEPGGTPAHPTDLWAKERPSGLRAQSPIRQHPSPPPARLWLCGLCGPAPVALQRPTPSVASEAAGEARVGGSRASCSSPAAPAGPAPRRRLSRSRQAGRAGLGREARRGRRLQAWAHWRRATDVCGIQGRRGGWASGKAEPAWKKRGGSGRSKKGALGRRCWGLSFVL